MNHPTPTPHPSPAGADASPADAAAETDADALRTLLARRFGHAVPVPAGTAGLDSLRRMAGMASHRDWSPQPVSDELIQLLAACALSAPSKSYLQQADIVHLRNPAMRAEVQALVPGMPWMARAPALLVFCANGRRFKRLFDRRGQPFTNDHLDGFFNPVVDASMVMMNFIQAAAAVGLVCCPISLIRNQPQRVAEVLALPARVLAVAGLCLGHAAQVREANPRLRLAACLHVDRMGEPDDDAAVDDFDRRYVEARQAVLPPSAPAPRPWSAERADQYAQAQRADWGAFVRGQGFDLS